MWYRIYKAADLRDKPRGWYMVIERGFTTVLCIKQDDAFRTPGKWHVVSRYKTKPTTYQLLSSREVALLTSSNRVTNISTRESVRSRILTAKYDTLIPA